MLAEQPPLDAAALLCLEAWQKLESCRPIGPVCAGPIPRLAVKQWADWEGIDSDLALVIADVIYELDVKRAKRITTEFSKRKGQQP